MITWCDGGDSEVGGGDDIWRVYCSQHTLELVKWSDAKNS